MARTTTSTSGYGGWRCGVTCGRANVKTLYQLPPRADVGRCRARTFEWFGLSSAWHDKYRKYQGRNCPDLFSASGWDSDDLMPRISCIACVFEPPNLVS